MRQGHQNNRNNRQRNRGRRQNSGGGNQSNKVYDSNGPDVRVRGSAQTVADKYLQLAGDAQSQGDRIKTESYFQYAEHYLRIVAANLAIKNQKQAEKEKAAEEHTARMQAKQEKAAAQLEKKSVVAPDSGEASKSQNGEDEWGGHQPAFLQREENAGSDKPKKTRSKKPKSSKKSDEPSAVGVSTTSENEAETTSAS